jgi:release factor glutamine methyltransferase
MTAAAPRTWTVVDLLRWTADHFASKGIDTPRLDAECLLAFALESDRLRLYLEYDKPVHDAERARFRELVKRRAEDRVPVALLTGRREFWSLPLQVTPDVLVPRPETETLVQVALDRLRDCGAALRILDVGTGSGAVALALLSELPQARAVATDVSAAALAVAERNARALGLDGRLELRLGDALEPVRGERFDLLVSNPPYVAESEAGTLAPELACEPVVALFAGRDGTDLLRRLVTGAPALLAAGGALGLELAPAQAPAVTQWMAAEGFEDVRVARDLAGRARVASAALARGGTAAAARGGAGAGFERG